MSVAMLHDVMASAYFSWHTCSGEIQVSYCEDIGAALWSGPCQEELKLSSIIQKEAEADFQQPPEKAILETGPPY